MLQIEDIIFMISEKISKLSILSIYKGVLYVFWEINRKLNKKQLLYLQQILKLV